ncbi:MAG TPA: hypothetical protein VFM29_06925, partial [Vicinamibacteria bacterium]|nr:hypothetical protein [Vicinamibacteria bacterium]
TRSVHATRLHSGQRVRHARYGFGVTTTCTEDRTTIDFEEHGVKTFISSILEVEVLSPPGSHPPKRGKARAKKG